MDVKNRIKEQTEVYKWDFLYLAANQDAFESGEALGVSRDNCVSWGASRTGIAYACDSMASFAKKVRLISGDETSLISGDETI